MSTPNVINIKRSNSAKNGGKVSPLRLTDELKNSELEELYNSTFYEIVMNARGRYEPNQYDTILSIICPSLSYKFQTLHPKRAESLITEYCNMIPGDKEFLKNMPDQASAVNHVFLHFFKEFYKNVKEEGIQSSLDLYEDFFFTNESVFKTLPVSFVFSLVNFVEKK